MGSAEKASAELLQKIFRGVFFALALEADREEAVAIRPDIVLHEQGAARLPLPSAAAALLDGLRLLLRLRRVTVIVLVLEIIKRAR